jgi:HD-like signal output (HDOD) protein/ActR/RegA family two-component response regulator
MDRKRHLLFVDDEPRILDGLRRQLYSKRGEWEITYVTNSADALEQLAQKPFDVVISDMRMPGMDGAQLLQKVMSLYPNTARLVLSAQSDKETLLRALGPAHQYLIKPCTAEILKDTLSRLFVVQDLFADGSLKRLVTQMRTVPSLPALYYEILTACQSPDTSAEAVGQIISRDIGMTAKILQLVNSAAFGLHRPVLTPTQAVIYLGLDTMKNLALTAQIFASFEPVRLGTFSLPRLWNHSTGVAALVCRIAETERLDPRQFNEMCLAGLLHDVGQLIFAANFNDEYDRVLEAVHSGEQPLEAIEHATFGATHARVGAYLLGMWGLPNAIVEALAYHHTPAVCPTQTFSALTAVHVADAWEHALHPEPGRAAAIDRDYLQALNLTERLTVWQAQPPAPDSGGV